MRCLICRKAGKNHTLNISPRREPSIKGKVETFWDDEDVYHNHNHTNVRVKIWCSEGHKGVIIGKAPCCAPGCEFGQDEKIEWEER